MDSAKELTLYKKQKHTEKTIYKNVQDNASSVRIAALENGRCGKHIGSVVDKGGLFKKAKDCIQCLKIAGLLNQKKKKKKASKGGAIFVDDKKNPIPPPVPSPILFPVIPLPPPLPPFLLPQPKREIKNKCLWCALKKDWASFKINQKENFQHMDNTYKKWINRELYPHTSYGPPHLTFDCKVGPTNCFISRNKEWDLITHQFHQSCFWEALKYNGKDFPLNKCPVCASDIGPDELNKFFSRHPDMQQPHPCDDCVIV